MLVFEKFSRNPPFALKNFSQQLEMKKVLQERVLVVPRLSGGNIHRGLLALQCVNSGLKLGQLSFRLRQLFHRVHRSPSDRSAVVTVAIIDEGLKVGLFEVPMVTVFPFELQETTVGQIPHIPLAGFKFFCRLFKVQYIFHLSLKQRTSFVSPVAPGHPNQPCPVDSWDVSRPMDSSDVRPSHSACLEVSPDLQQFRRFLGISQGYFKYGRSRPPSSWKHEELGPQCYAILCPL
jgi:hypothetical protein